MKKLFKVVLPSILCITFLFTGCSSKVSTNSNVKEDVKIPTEKVVLTMWTNDKKLHEAEINEYQTLNPNVKVEVTYQGNYDDIVQKVQAGIAANELPNISVLGQRHGINQMYDSGYLIPIEDMISKETTDDILDELWERFTYKDKKMTIPFKSSAPALYYNKQMLKEVGKEVPNTWEEMISMAKDLTKDLDGDGATDIYGVNFAPDTPWYVQPVVWNQGQTIINDNGDIVINSKEVAYFFESLHKLTHIDKSMPSNQHATAQDEFTNGSLALYVGSGSSYNSIVTSSEGKVDVGITYFPEINERTIPIGGNSLGIFKSNETLEKESAKLIEFLLTKENTLKYTSESGYIAVRKSISESDEFKKLIIDNPDKETIYEQFKYLKGQKINPADSLIWQDFMQLIDKVEAEEGTDIKKELDKIQLEVEEFVKNYN